jgi:hypothetical protein
MGAPTIAEKFSAGTLGVSPDEMKENRQDAKTGGRIVIVLVERGMRPASVGRA